MGNKIITVGREFGSGGRAIGELAAKKMCVKCYDKELIKAAAKASGLWEELLDNMDEKPTNSFLYSLVMDPYSYSYQFENQNYNQNLNQKAFGAVYNTIRTIADKESAVFIGRCSNYILRDYDNVLNVFIYASEENKIKRLMERYENMTEKKAREMIVKQDKARANYYNFYTPYKWGSRASYDMMIDSALLGVEGTADLLVEMVDKL